MFSEYFSNRLVFPLPWCTHDLTTGNPFNFYVHANRDLCGPFGMNKENRNKINIFGQTRHGPYVLRRYKPATVAEKELLIWSHEAMKFVPEMSLGSKSVADSKRRVVGVPPIGSEF